MLIPFAFTLFDPLPGGIYSGANGVNESGTVCGYRSIGPGVNPQTAFIWDATQNFDDLGTLSGSSTHYSDLSNGPHISGWVGSSSTSATTLGLALLPSDPTMLPPVPGGTTSPALATNDGGDVCGFGRIPAQGGVGTDNRAFWWHENAITNIGVLAGFRRSFGVDCNLEGVVVGYCRTLLSGQDARNGFVWCSTSGMLDVNDLMTDSSAPEVIAVNGVSSDGTLVAEGAGVVALVILPSGLNDGDLNRDCRTNVTDLLLVITHWGATGDSVADANHDQVVNVTDLLIVVSLWSSP